MILIEKNRLGVEQFAKDPAFVNVIEHGVFAAAAAADPLDPNHSTREGNDRIAVGYGKRAKRRSGSRHESWSGAGGLAQHHQHRDGEQKHRGGGRYNDEPFHSR